MACGRTGAVTHLAKSISLFLFERKGRKAPASLSFAALQDRLALLLGYVKNDVVTQDRLALLWTIEAACGGSPSRAPETHPVLAAPALAPACRPDCRAVFKELAVVGSPLRSGGRCPWIASPGRLWCAVARWAVSEDSPFCPTNHTHTRQQTHASNPCGYDKAPKVVAFGNGRKEGISLKDTAWSR